MKLSELDPQFLRRVVEGDRELLHYVDALAVAHGISFLCPVCFIKNKGCVGTHTIICWFTGRVPNGVTPGPGRWNPQGTGYADLSFIGPGSSSVWLTGPGCGAHFHLSRGEIHPC